MEVEGKFEVRKIRTDTTRSNDEKLGTAIAVLTGFAPAEDCDIVTWGRHKLEIYRDRVVFDGKQLRQVAMQLEEVTFHIR